MKFACHVLHCTCTTGFLIRSHCGKTKYVANVDLGEALRQCKFPPRPYHVSQPAVGDIVERFVVLTLQGVAENCGIGKSLQRQRQLRTWKFSMVWAMTVDGCL